jgi:16S rRNA (cytidine1402-2'-O)-methyltransferase
MADAPLPPGLHVCATPIGNLGDASPRLVRTLSQADAVLCEDSRVTGGLLGHLGIEARMIPYHDHNGAAVRPRILEALENGAAYALVSDAGTPLVSDPGYKLVAEARARGVAVHAVPGPSAPIAALMVSGTPTHAFSFHGFVPAKDKARRDLFASLRARDETILLFETAPRLAVTLAAVAEVMGERQVSVARELTKRFEEVVTGAAPALAARYAEAGTKGEIVLVLHPPAGLPALSQEEVDARLRAALSEGKVKDAAALVAEATGLPRRDLYARALTLKAEG